MAEQVSDINKTIPTVKLANIAHSFNDHLALDNINVEFPESSFNAVIGPNGGGKTTMLKIITGLVKPSKGEVSIFGFSTDKIPEGTIGYVPQVKTLDRSFPAKAIELVANGLLQRWPARINLKTRELCMEALKKTGAISIAERQLNKLSGGELQRVYMARAIVRNPRLLLLDEPITGVDPAGGHDINLFLDNIRKERKITVIVVTHDWEMAFHHTEFVLIINRRIVCYDKPKSAFKEENLRKAFGHIGHAHDMIFSLRD